ncbi:MAG: DUF1364 family protein [Flavobacteriaceae bacterium]|nr:DUF1364 family protein [Flavobacteriaceae bacterium]
MVALRVPVSDKLIKRVTQSARDQRCWLALPDVCNGNPDTVVFAHFRSQRLGAGMGRKPTFWGAPACSSCHDEADRRTRKLENDFVRFQHCMATLAYVEYLRCESVITVS